MFSVQKFRLIMAKKCLTLREIAARSGVSAVAIGCIVNHGQKPQPATVGKLAKGLGVDVVELLADD